MKKYSPPPARPAQKAALVIAFGVIALSALGVIVLLHYGMTVFMHQFPGGISLNFRSLLRAA